ncbi:7-carboxy-7-deazaguanine synthase [Paenibacillus nuruki]|uniref:7-carboxy-7-deazaguanine synthase n=1 Tax=Paenibacillus nuruki TaxID=1886670 RepID=A0A1E3KZL5_9BACL|nr:7-carboxy-7-deazaguanine synthase QueE [Paenibacillus nuruki]ODP26853.1 7-carboxy-7-deazaguanine synthase [Paenibacillus nuruki]
MSTTFKVNAEQIAKANQLAGSDTDNHDHSEHPHTPKIAPIPVLEIFGPTVQGEGMVIGQKTMFVRTAGCDYRCSWCDSAFTWDGSAKDQIMRLSAEEVYAQLFDIGGDRFNHVTISGGNPALLPQLGQLVQLLSEKGIRTAVETQGSKWQDWLTDINEVTISPKPPSSGMTTNFEVLDDIIRRLEHNQISRYTAQAQEAPLSYAGTSQFAHSFSLKVVIFDEQDLAYAEKVHLRYPNVLLYLQTGNPDVTSADDQIAASLLKRYEWLIDQAMDMPAFNDARILPQLHTLVWGNKRGV